METKKVFLVIADISGYTNFVRQEKIGKLHAEKIVCELLESVIDATDNTLTYYEHAGDAVTFYAESEGNKERAKIVFEQVKQMFKAFNEKQRLLAHELETGNEEVSHAVEQLKLKTIIHHGEVVFTKIKNIIKVAGQDVIIAHRLLKNSVSARQYILTTEEFQSVAGCLGKYDPQKILEYYDGIGKVKAVVYNSIHGVFQNKVAKRNFAKRLLITTQIEQNRLKKSFWRFVENYGRVKRLGWNF